MTLNEGQCHSNCHQTIQITSVCHHKFERNWSDVQMQANVKFFFDEITKVELSSSNTDQMNYNDYEVHQTCTTSTVY